MKKSKGDGASKKTEQKKKEKVAQDLTFGLKNKNKSKVVQSYVKQVTAQVVGGDRRGGEDKRIADEFRAKEEKKKELEQKALIQSLFKSVSAIQQQNLKEGEDPKSVLCAYFKAGMCEKGKKCKYSHDLAIENKSAKIDIHTDPRDRAGKPVDRTDITCQHFLDAVEKNLYGWLWECPNGGEKCIYTHALPPGYVLQRDKKEADRALLDGDDSDELTVEEKIEEERAALPSEGLTPVTLETLTAWKQRKAEKKQKELEERMKEEAKSAKGGKGTGILSGRMLFKYDPTLF
jgi:DRG Family Regulatory Proteins, Tma46/Torus domain